MRRDGTRLGARRPASTISLVHARELPAGRADSAQKRLVLGWRSESEIVGIGRRGNQCDGARDRLVDGQGACAELMLVQVGEVLVEVPCDVLGLQNTNVPASLRSLPYAKARTWSVPSVSTRSLDCPRSRSPSTPSTTTSRAVPTNATSSLTWTPAGTRPTARTSGLSAGLSSRRFEAPAAASAAGRVPPTSAQIVSSDVLPTKFVISQRPSILATSRLPAVTAATLPVSTSMK